MVSGSFWINKPAGLSSSDVVVRLKVALTKNHYCKKGFKIGHGGTLDPFATGALVVLIGEATKLADPYLHSIKSYSGVITLGKKTDTADWTGTVVQDSPVPQLDPTEWQRLANTFTKDEYWQTPPMYSAKKIGGKTLHSLARKGMELERKSILKKIDSFEVGFENENQDALRFSIRCESGTYVRVIAEDLALKAGTLAHLKSLTRTRTSDVDLMNCSDLETVIADLNQQKPLSALHCFHPLQEVATHLPSIDISETESRELRQGLQRTVQALISRIHSHLDAPKYVIGRLDERNPGFPVALFERQSETDSILKPIYRLQRVLLEEPNV